MLQSPRSWVALVVMVVGCSAASNPKDVPPKAVPPATVLSSASNESAAQHVPETSQSATSAPIISASAPISSSASAQTKVSPTPISGKGFRYREVFTGELSFRAKYTTYTLTLSSQDSRFQLIIERGEGSKNSIVIGKNNPLQPTQVEVTEKLGRIETDAKGLVLHFDDSKDPPIRCKKGSVMALSKGALLQLTHITGTNSNRANWVPASRRSHQAYLCERGNIAPSAVCSDEPQPENLPFVALPGIEYVHENDDMVVQKGGLREL